MEQRILYYDCFSGISGDMHLGALLDLGVDASALADTLSLLDLAGEYELRIARGTRRGIAGTKVDVVLSTSNLPHRRLGDISDIIHGSGLPTRVQELSMRTFALLAGAEAGVHGTTVDEVHFHEVGATDAIVDIVGAAICLEALGVDAVYASPVELGGGMVTCAHGRIPVPAPATLALLRGVPVTFGAVPFETTTPTGAAILATYVDTFGAPPAQVIDAVGYGLGSRDTEIPNVLRACLGRATGGIKGRWDHGRAVLVETSIDDMSPELHGPMAERLYEAGARDVLLIPVQMKKGRAGILVSALCEEDAKDEVIEALFRETTTLGVRTVPVDKHMLRRGERTMETTYGPVRVKDAFLGGEWLKSKPEHDDCRRIAREQGLSLPEVYRRIGLLMGDGPVP